MEKNKKTIYLIACIGTLICVFIIIGLNFASIQPQNDPEPEKKQTEVSLDEVSGMSNLDFLSEEEKKQFAYSLREYIVSLDKAWPAKIEIYKKTNKENDTVEFYFQILDDQTYHACLYDTEKKSFTFYEKAEIEGITNKPTVAETPKQKEQESKPETSQQEPQSNSQEKPTQPEVVSQPVKITSATELLSYIPQSQFNALPKIITQHLKQKGISADGTQTIIDVATITPNSVGVQFSGWVTDATGTKQNLTIEYNSARSQFGIGVNL